MIPLRPTLSFNKLSILLYDYATKGSVNILLLGNHPATVSWLWSGFWSILEVLYANWSKKPVQSLILAFPLAPSSGQNFYLSSTLVHLSNSLVFFTLSITAAQSSKHGHIMLKTYMLQKHEILPFSKLKKVNLHYAHIIFEMIVFTCDVSHCTCEISCEFITCDKYVYVLTDFCVTLVVSY